MTRYAATLGCFALLVTLATPVLAQQAQGQSPLAQGRAGLKTRVGALDLTDAQRTTIKSVFASHRAALQEARSSGDQKALREARRAMLQDVVKVLTPEQRERLKGQLGKRLRGTVGRG